MATTARRAAIASLVVGGIVVLALALWKLRLLIALLFLGFIIAAAMRPGVEWLQRHRIPRGIGVAVHYAVLFAAVGLLLYLVVPRALNQVTDALETLPGEGGQSAIGEEAEESSGLKQEILTALERRLENLPSGEQLLDPALELTLLTFEVAIGIFFVLATGVYWIFERRHAVEPGDVARAPPRAQEGARHLGSDRPQARRLRARPAHPDRARGDGAVAGVLGHRAAVLAAGRDLRGRGRDHPGHRPAGRRALWPSASG